MNFRDTDYLREAFAPKEKQITVEEMNKYALDPNLSDIEKCLVCLRSVYPVQKIAAISNLPFIVKMFPGEFVVQVLPCISKHINRFDENLQSELAESLIKLLADKSVDTKICEAIYPIVYNMMDSQITGLFNHNIDVLKLLIPFLSEFTLRKFCDVVYCKLADDQILQCRSSFCQIMGILSKLVPSDYFISKFLDRILALCQDTEVEIRRAMSDELDSIARCVGLKVTTSVLLPQIMELINDEDQLVRVKSLVGIVSLADFVSSEFRDKTITPLFISKCLQFSKKDFNQESDTSIRVIDYFSEKFGFMISKLFAISKLASNIPVDAISLVNGSNFQAVLNFYTFISASNAPYEIRCWAAYNLPSLFYHFSANSSSLLNILQLFASDSSLNLRKKVASFLHELALILEKKSYAYLKDIFFSFIRDAEISIRVYLRCKSCFYHKVTVMENAEVILNQFRLPDENPLMSEVFINSLCEYHETLETSWRPKQKLFETVGVCHRFFPSTLIYDKIIPIVFSAMHLAVLPVRITATRAFCQLLRHQTSNLRQFDLCSRLIGEFAQSRLCFRDRVTFLDACLIVLEIFSRRWFKDTFMASCLDLGINEKCRQVRLKMVQMLCPLKKTLVMPNDKIWLDKLLDILGRSLNDTDHQVSVAAQAISEEFSKIQARVDSITPNDDSDDIRKESEELVFVEKSYEDLKHSGDIDLRSSRSSKRYDPLRFSRNLTFSGPFALPTSTSNLKKPVSIVTPPEKRNDSTHTSPSNSTLQNSNATTTLGSVLSRRSSQSSVSKSTNFLPSTVQQATESKMKTAKSPHDIAKNNTAATSKVAPKLSSGAAINSAAKAVKPTIGRTHSPKVTTNVGVALPILKK